MMGGILAAGGRYGRRDRVFSRGELERDHTLYFHNVTCKAETVSGRSKRTTFLIRQQATVWG